MSKTVQKNISKELFDTFYVDDYKYGRQLSDGSYRLIRERITPVTIENMLEESKSLLTYQELHTLNDANIKWICIDLDISKQEIEKNSVNEVNLKLVKESADEICTFLQSINIPYLLEFSGRRGFHIWIIFDELISKEEGFYLISYILSKVKLKNNIIADKFPAVPLVGKYSKGVGKGVKLPLSQNKSSKKLSFFIDVNDEFDFNSENWLAIPNIVFLEKQYEILRNKKTVTTEQIKNLISDYTKLGFLSKNEKYLISSRVKETYLSDDISLEKIITSLRKCEHIADLLKDYQKGLSGKTRNILCGLLGNLKTPNDSEFGTNVLLELFSKIKGYNEEITRKQLRNIKYLSPITCNFLGNCESCNKKGITSPVELIEGIVLEDRPNFEIKNIDSKLFLNLKAALKKYSLLNDEVPLFTQLEKIEVVAEKEIQSLVDEVLNGNTSMTSQCFKFDRIEGSKTRTLYNLDYRNNLVSSYFLFVLNNLFYSEISNYSYGYEVSPSFYNDNLFTNWFVNWGKFSKHIEQIIFGEEYDEHFVVKIDIKGFYDNINLQRLGIKLYEEAPKKIKNKLNELQPEELRKYKNITKYLLSLTKETTGDKEKGVPQGPAYARYLAEIYLLGLDKTIEDFIQLNQGREFYNRFVDDAYIFLETEERANELYAKIENWLSINDLQLNKLKSELCNVKDYRDSGKFNRYKDDVKYTINQANKNKNVLTEGEVSEALNLIENLTHDAKFGLKDNLRFFYYQFREDPRLIYIRKKLAKILPFQKNGRGTLYMIFYKDLLKTLPESFNSLAEHSDKLVGLSLTHYLNTILLEWDRIDHSRINFSELLEKTSLNEKISDVDKLLILTIAMKLGVGLGDHFIKKCTKEIIRSAMETPNIKYSAEQYELLKSSLEDIRDGEPFVKGLYRIINLNELDIEVANNLANYTLARFSEWETFNNEEILFLNDEENLSIYYHCLCYFTLFHTADNNTAVTSAWSTLLKISVKTKVSANIEFGWLNQLVNFKSSEYSKSSYGILLGKTSGSQFRNYDCKNDFIDRYLDVLLFLLFSNKDTLAQFRDNMDDHITDSLFYKWIQNESVELYPDGHRVCMQNLAVNGLIVLENKAENKIFIKGVNRTLEANKFNFITPIPHNLDDNEFEYVKEGFTPIDDELDKSTFVNFLISLNDKIQKHAKFRTEFSVNYPVLYSPIFLKDGFPLVPFYSTLENKAITLSGEINENNIEYYWENLLEVVHSLNNNSVIKIVEEDNPFNYSIGDIESRFFPRTELIIQSNHDKVKFIAKFCEIIKNERVESINDFQYYWSLAVLKLLENNKGNHEAILLTYLNAHFNHFTEGKKGRDTILDILFSVTDDIEISHSNLSEFFNSIVGSIIRFQSQLSNSKSNISDVFNNYIDIIEKAFSNIEQKETGNLRLSLKDFVSKEISYTQSFNHATKEDENLLKINELKIRIENTHIYNRSACSFEPLTSERADTLKNKKYLFSKSKGDLHFIYVPDNELIKAFDRLLKRKEIYESLKKDGSEDAFASNRSLFPEDASREKAKRFYDQMNTNGLDSILKNHYCDATNLRERVVNWLSLFNEKSIEGSELKKFMDEKSSSIDVLYRAIIECLKTHIPISNEDLDYFKSCITEYNNTEEHIIFPLKQPYQDGNGLSRLFVRCDLRQRDIDVDKYARLLFSEDCTAKELIIAADISISGAQAGKALDFYLSEYDSHDQFVDRTKKVEKENEKYFVPHDFKGLEQLQNNIRGVKKIIFISPIMTEDFQEKVSSKLIELGVKGKIEFQKNSLLTKEDYLFGKKILDQDSKKLIYALLKDSDLINSIFNGPYYESNYNNDGKIDARNTLLRIQSLPSRHIQLFSLLPKNGSKSLLEYVKNWKR